MSQNKQAAIIGNSDGIGLSLTERLLDMGWTVRGLSRSGSSIRADSYKHSIVDVTSDDYQNRLLDAVGDGVDLCVYCAGIGELFDIGALEFERKVFEVNLIGALKTFEIVLPGMLQRKAGHIIILSSIGDEAISPEAPSYHASKAGLSSYIEGLAMGVKKYGVAVTNLRFGFVDTKMAKGDHRPFMMTVDRAVDHVVHCIKKRPVRYSRPRVMAILVKIHRFLTRLKM